MSRMNLEEFLKKTQVEPTEYDMNCICSNCSTEITVSIPKGTLFETWALKETCCNCECLTLVKYDSEE